MQKNVNEMDFYEAYKYDKRTFFEAFHDLLLENVMFINTFFVTEPLKPFLLKLIIYLLYITLFFIINGLFFSEDYISQVYHLEKKDKFFSFVPRSIKRFFYTLFVGTIMQFIIGCFFIKEKRIKKIFIREKNNVNNLKHEIIALIKIMQKRMITFFILVFLIFIFSFLYVISFNYVYHFTQFEWIKSSIFIIIVTDLIMLLLSFILICIRFISFKCKSDRIYNLGNRFSKM